MLTYSQNFEDVMLARLFQGQARGFYVDVGAWHPSWHSVTRHFYELGWRGINVEPIPAQYQFFVRDRPRDINLNVGVGAASGLLRFHECIADTALSTLDAAQAQIHARRGLEIRTYDIEVLTLQAIIDAHGGGQEIDFLKIDVEGWEQEVLRGLDLSRCTPRVLVIEATKPASPITNWDDIGAIESWTQWEPMVLGSGYVLAHFDGLSRFYLRRDLATLARRLALPPGVFDSIEYPQVADLIEQLRVANADREARQEIMDRLGAELEERARVIEGLAARLREAETHGWERLWAMARRAAKAIRSKPDAGGSIGNSNKGKMQ